MRQGLRYLAMHLLHSLSGSTGVSAALKAQLAVTLPRPAMVIRFMGKLAQLRGMGFEIHPELMSHLG
jgi:hypothetical protein